MSAWLRHRVVRHVLFWSALWGFFLLIQLPDHFITGSTVYWREYLLVQLPTALLATYPLLYWILPQLLQRRQVLLFLGLLAGWLVGSALLANMMHDFYMYVVAPGLFQQPPPKQPFQWSMVTEMLYFNFFALLIISGAASAIKVANGWYEQRKISQQLQQRKLHAELQLLKAQLQPPFLFGTLRTLHTLTLEKSADSPAAVLQLSALLRYMLYESPQEAVPLADEVEMMRCYVALEKLRVGSRVDVSLNFTGSLTAHTIAPLLLLPFVENAFQHGTGLGLECPWVSIDLIVKRNSVTLKVINSQQDAEVKLREGAGLRSIRQRLEHLYPGRHELKILTEADTFVIVLNLQLAPSTTVSIPVAYSPVSFGSPTGSLPRKAKNQYQQTKPQP